MGSEQMTDPCVTGMTESGEWLTAEQFAGMEGMPGTAKGARLRLEKLTALHPEIRRKRTSGKGFLYHISAAGMALKSERDAADTSADEQLNLLIQLFRTMKPASKDKLLQQALTQVAKDLTEGDVHQ